LPWSVSTVFGSPKQRQRDPPFLGAPMDTRDGGQMWSCSYSMRLLDSGGGNSNASGVVGGPSAFLMKQLEWDKPLPIQVVVQQLLQLSAQLASYNDGSSSGSTSALSDQAKPQRQSEQRELLEQLTTVLPPLYRLLAHASEAAAPAAQGKSVLETLRSSLHGKDWLFVGERFVSSERVAFQSLSGVDLEPYHWRLPAELRVYAPFLRAMGVRECFHPSDCAEVLSLIAQTHGAASSATDASARPLGARELDTAVSLVQYLSDHVEHIHGAMYVPSERGALALAQAMVFQDAKWLMNANASASASAAGGKGKASAAAPAVLFVHPKLSNAVAEKVGVRSYRATLSASLSERLGVTSSGSDAALPSSLSAQAFGQKESLVQRLRNILALYPEGVGVLFELLQNADDAGAREMTLLFNADSYGTSSLLSGDMEAWQGPALYAYNDASFSEADFQNLSSIGQGSKLDKLASTGRFGLGFSAVYHFTDVPSLVSSGSVIMFDPHAKYLPGVSHREPGLRIPLGPMLMQAFPDQFAPLQLQFFGCDLASEFRGTLFRFPLRTEGTAAKSGIKKEPCTRRDMMGLLEHFKAAVVEALLFLRHVTKVTVVVHEEGQSRELYSAELADRSQRDKGVWAKLPAFAGAAPAASTSGSSVMSKGAFYKRLESCPEEDLPRGMQVSRVRLTVHEYELKASAAADVSPSQPASEASAPAFALQSSRTSQDTFLLSEQLGGGRSRVLAIEGAATGQKMLPFGGVAAHLLHEPDVTSSAAPQAVDLASPQALGGKAFCFLPLPLTTGLPVHCNAFFELSANRRDIWLGSDMTGAGAMRSAWNTALLLDVCAPAYARLLVAAARLLGPRSSQFFSLFPHAGRAKTVSNSSATAEAWQILSSRVYALLQGQAFLFTPATAWRDPTRPAQAALPAPGPAASALGRALVVARTAAAPHAPAQGPSSVLRDVDITALSTTLRLSEPRDVAQERQGLGQWIAPRYAVTIDDDAAKAVEPSGKATVELVEDAEKKAIAPALPVAGSPSAPPSFAEYGRLGSILLSCGIPVVQLPSAHRTLLVQHGGSTAPAPSQGGKDSSSNPSPTSAGPRHVDPAFIRQWLRSLGAVPSSLSRSDVLFLLHYALADMLRLSSSKDKEALVGLFAQLRGVPLVPLYDGTWGVFGAPLPPDPSLQQQQAHRQYYLLSAEDVSQRQLHKLLSPAASHLIYSPALEADVARLLADAMFQSQSNIAVVDEVAVARLIPFCLPQQWAGKDAVEYVEPALAAADDAVPDPSTAAGVVRPRPHTVPSLAWLALLWSYLSRSGGVKDLSLFARMPLVLANAFHTAGAAQVPAPAGGVAAGSSSLLTPPPSQAYLCRLDASSGGCHLLCPDSKTPLSSLPGALLTGLSKLGLRVVDTVRVPQVLQPNPHEKLFEYVHAFTVSGVLACVDSQVRGGLHTLPAFLRPLTAAERLTLRSWVARCLSPRTLEGGLNQPAPTERERELLRHMDIFEAYGAPPEAAPARPAAAAMPVAAPVVRGASAVSSAPRPTSPPPAAAATPASSVSKFYFVDLVSEPRLRPPEGVPSSLLSSRFLWLQGRHDASLLEVLGVASLRETEFYRESVFPAAVLTRLPAAERNATMLALLERIDALVKEDAEFLLVIAKLPFLPTQAQAQVETLAAKAGSVAPGAAGGGLLTPSQLFDPSVSEFRALLDPAVHFPSAPFDAPHLLQTLVRLGLQTSVDRRGVLDVASGIVTSVARLAREPAASVAVERERAKALLRYVDLHSARLLEADEEEEEENEEEKFIPSAAASGKGAKPQQTKSSASAKGNVSSSSSPKESLSAFVSPDRVLSRSAFLLRLCDLGWLPVHVSSPIPLLPWSSSGGAASSQVSSVPNAVSQCFAPARRVRPVADAWLCSATLKLLDGEVRSAELSAALGWQEPLAAVALCQQLLRLSEASRAAQSSGTAAALATHINSTVPLIYAQLTAHISRPPGDAQMERDKAIMAATLKGQAWLCHGGHFYTAARFAFPPGQYPEAGPGAPSSPRAASPGMEDLAPEIVAPDARPFLHEVPLDLMPFASLLALLGVRARFDPSDYAFALKNIAQDAQTRAQSASLHPAVGAASTSTALPAPPGPSCSPPPTGSAASTPAAAHLTERELDLSISIVTYLGHLQDARNAASAAEAAAAGKRPKLTLLIKPAELLVPSDRGVMIPASQLAFNDAAWLLATLAQKDSIAFVHPRLSNELAAKLGIKSLRELLLLNQSYKRDVPCPTPANIVRKIVDLLGPQVDLPGEDGAVESAPVAASASQEDALVSRNGVAGLEALTTALLDLVELADSAGARTCQVVLDHRAHPSESLFNPLLSAAQGPALVVYFDAVLMIEDILMMQSAAMDGSDAPVAGPSLPPAPAGSPTAASSAAGLPQRQSVHAGHGMLSCYAFSDSLFVLSGEALHVFDPLKKLFMENSAAAASAAGPAAASASAGPAAAKVEPSYGRTYTFTASGLGKRFAHQFEPFEALPFRFSKEKPFGGTILRMPLRHYAAASIGADTTLSPARLIRPVIEQVVSSMRSHFEPLLLFMRSLESFSLAMQPPHSSAGLVKIATAHVLAQQPMPNQKPLRELRKLLVNDVSWRKTTEGRGGLFGLFSSSASVFAPKRNCFELEISTLWSDPRSASSSGGGGGASNLASSAAAASGVETNVDVYAVAEVLGSGQSRDMALRFVKEAEQARGAGAVANAPLRIRAGREHPASIGSLVPLAAAAVRVRRNGQSAEPLSAQSRLFAGGVPLLAPMQLPSSGLPLHLSAPFALRRTSAGRFVHFDPSWTERFAPDWAAQVTDREERLEQLARPPQLPPQSPVPSPPPSTAAASPAPGSLAAAAAKSTDDWVPTKPETSSLSAGTPPSSLSDDEKDDGDSDDDGAEGQPRPPPQAVVARAAPSPQAVQLQTRQRILEGDPLAARRSAVHQWNVEHLSHSAVSAWIDLLVHVKSSLEKSSAAGKLALYKHFPRASSTRLMYARLVVRHLYERVGKQEPLPLFLLSSNDFGLLKSSLFKHAAMGAVVEAFITRAHPLFQVPIEIAEDLLLCGVVDALTTPAVAGASVASAANAPPLLPACVCTPFELRRLLRTNPSLRDAINAGVPSEVSRELLRFAMLDLGSTAHTDARYAELSGLRLVPLANGSTGSFGSRRFVLASSAAQALLPLASDIFLSESVHADPALLVHLESAPFARHYLDPFNARLVAAYLGRLFPIHAPGLFGGAKKKVIDWRIRRRDLMAARQIEDRSVYEGEDRQPIVEGSIVDLAAPPAAQAAPGSGAIGASAASAAGSASAARHSSSQAGSGMSVATAAGLPTAVWVRTLWQFISIRSADNRQVLAAWPLLPLLNKGATSAPSSYAGVTASASAAAAPASSVTGGALDDPAAASDEFVTGSLATVALWPHVLCLPSSSAWSLSTEVAEAMLELGYPLLDWAFFDKKYRSDAAVQGAAPAAAAVAAAPMGGLAAALRAVEQAAQVAMGGAAGGGAAAVAGGGAPQSLSLVDKVPDIPVKFLRSLPELFLSSSIDIRLGNLSEATCATLMKLLSDGFTAGAFNRSEDRRTVRMLPIFQCLPAPDVHSSEAPPVFRALDSAAGGVSSDVFMLAPELVSSLPTELVAYVARSGAFVAYRFPELQRWAGVKELTKTQLLERVLVPFIEEEIMGMRAPASASALVMGSAAAAASSSSFVGSASAQSAASSLSAQQRSERQDAFIQTHLVSWVNDSVLSAATKAAVAALPIIPVKPPQSQAMGAESKEEEEAAASSSSSSSAAPFVPPLRVAASSLFDPRVRFFSDLFSDEAVFPSASYEARPELLDFLVALGLRQKLDADAFVLCATKIAQASSLARKPFPAPAPMDQQPQPMEAGESGSDAEEAEEARMFNVATRLLDHLISQYNELSTPKLWKTLRPLRWVPVRFRGVRLCVRFGDLAVSKDRALAWTALPVLPAVQSPPVVLHAQMGLVSPPSVVVVMDHVQRIASVPLEQWDRVLNADQAAVGGNGRLEPTKVFLELFAYLDTHWAELSPAQQTVLRRLPLVPIGGALTRASRLYFRLDQNLSPFLFEVPRLFGAYDALFRRLGTNDLPTRRDYLNLLYELYVELNATESASAHQVESAAASRSDAMAGGTLNCNELSAVVKVLHLLVDSDNADESAQEASAMPSRSASSGASNAQPLLVYVPNESARLVPAYSCVFSDSSLLSARISHRKLHVVNAVISARLARKAGVRALTDAVEERLQTLVNIDQSNELQAALTPEQCQRVQELLHAEEFSRAVIRLYEDQISRSHAYTQHAQLPSLSSLHGLLRTYSVQFCMSLRTRLVLQPEGVDVTSEGSGLQDGSLALVHVDSATRLIYVNLHQGELDAVRPTLVLANALALILAKAIPAVDALRNITPLNALIDTALLEPAALAQAAGVDVADSASLAACRLSPLLDRLEVSAIDHEALRRGVVGELLHPLDAAVLQLAPLRKFHAGELVAFRDQQGQHRYGQVVRDETAVAATVSSPSSGGSAANSTAASSSAPGGDASSGGAFSSLLVRIHPSKTALLSSADLFCFTSHMQAAAASGHSVTEQAEKLLRANEAMSKQMHEQTMRRQQSHAGQPAAARPVVLQPAQQSPAAAVPALIASASAADSASAASVPLDRSRAQLLSAVSSLLQQAQLPLSLDAATLARENLSLRAACEAAERRAGEAHARESTLTSKIERLQNAFTCVICQTCDVQLVLNPCGHTVCEGCEKQLVQKRCPFCRERYSGTIPFRRPDNSA